MSGFVNKGRKSVKEEQGGVGRKQTPCSKSFEWVLTAVLEFAGTLPDGFSRPGLLLPLPVSRPLPAWTPSLKVSFCAG